jgi:hypothetical protein
VVRLLHVQRVLRAPTAREAAHCRAGAGCAGLAATRHLAAARVRRALRVLQGRTALRAATHRVEAGCAGLAATRHLAAARVRRALRALQGLTAFRGRYLSVLQVFFRIIRVETRACPVMQVHFAVALASRLSAVFALQDRSLSAFLARLPARPAPQASTAQLRV